MEIENIDRRWTEVDRLIDEATNSKEIDSELYDIMCRAASVMMSAHFEGFMKDIVKAILKDANSILGYENMPKSVKNTFASYYLCVDDSNKEYNKLSKLNNILDSTNVEVVSEPFILPNKNPKASVIKTISKRFGIDDFFGFIHHSKLDLVFENSRSETEEFLSEFRSKIVENIEQVPYKFAYDRYDIKKRPSSEKNTKTLFEEFLEEFLQIRHSIAHGNNMQNSVSDVRLNEIKQKLKILQLAFVVLVSKPFSSSV
jgi:hypothetical protein